MRKAGRASSFNMQMNLLESSRIMKSLREKIDAEKAMLFTEPALCAVSLDDIELAKRVMECAHDIGRIGNDLCLFAKNAMDESNCTTIRKLVAKLLALEFMCVEEHIFGLHPQLLPDYMLYGDVEKYLQQCRMSSAHIEYDDFKEIEACLVKIDSLLKS